MDPVEIKANKICSESEDLLQISAELDKLKKHDKSLVPYVDEMQLQIEKAVQMLKTQLDNLYKNILDQSDTYAEIVEALHYYDR